MPEPRVGAIIQARMGSSRLPGKVLADIEGRTMLARVIDRVRLAREVHDVLVATSDAAGDDAVAAAAAAEGLTAVRGSEHDVLDRYVQAARHARLDVVVRVTADCPLLDPDLTDAVIRLVIDGQGQVDYAANTLRRTFPRGLDVEVAPMATLERAWREARSLHERAHVFPWVYEVPGRCRLAGVTHDTDWSHLRWTVDTPEDLAAVRGIYRALAGRAFRWRDVLAVVAANPALADVNAGVRQKTAHE